MDGIPTSFATGVTGAIAAQTAHQQRRAARILARRLPTTAGDIDTGSLGAAAIEQPARDAPVAPQPPRSLPRLDVRA